MQNHMSCSSQVITITDGEPTNEPEDRIYAVIRHAKEVHPFTSLQQPTGVHHRVSKHAQMMQQCTYCSAHVRATAAAHETVYHE